MKFSIEFNREVMLFPLLLEDILWCKFSKNKMAQMTQHKLVIINAAVNNLHLWHINLGAFLKLENRINYRLFFTLCILFIIQCYYYVTYPQCSF